MAEITYGKAKLTDSLRISVLLKTVYIQTYAVEGVTFEVSNFITKRFSLEHIESIIKENLLHICDPFNFYTSLFNKTSIIFRSQIDIF